MPFNKKSTFYRELVVAAFILVILVSVLLLIGCGIMDRMQGHHMMGNHMRGWGQYFMRGSQHSQDYRKIAEEGEVGKENIASPVELGKQVYTIYGCNACHSINGASMTGPTWKGLYGKTRILSDNSEVVADENYLRTSIVSPSSQVVKGYGNVMPPFALSDRQIEGVIAYIKTVK